MFAVVVSAALGFSSSVPPQGPSALLKATVDAFGVSILDLFHFSRLSYPEQLDNPPRPDNTWNGWNGTRFGETDMQGGLVFTRGDTRIMAMHGFIEYILNRGALHDWACIFEDHTKTGFVENVPRSMCDDLGMPARGIQDLGDEMAAVFDQYGPIDLITGHSTGCRMAQTEGRIRNIPVICWSNEEYYTPSWIEGYPGLKDAIVGHTIPSDPVSYVLNQDSEPVACYPYPNMNDVFQVSATCRWSTDPRCDGVAVNYSMNSFSTCFAVAHFPNTEEFPHYEFPEEDCTFGPWDKIARCAPLEDRIAATTF